MPINEKHKLSLLVDILKNQVEQEYMTTDEYDQISRLTSSLLHEGNLDPTLKQTFLKIQEQHYGNTHQFNQNDVEHWVETIQQYESNDNNS
ncbi:YtzH-like family protein [Alkalihalobacillus sp. LMS39]|uniref:YtzH-like family protein n=1 Tax=Alkalihalobacillus sp. LMS39 TaxID=2924032 RepID=UPI001FB4DB94|nr:YtzH-like family protein [Alkalihalobacillus sp. LMS39]UOE93500.1 YtzH-like family protein [Alkalihalobacillus sp. LMS39]